MKHFTPLSPAVDLSFETWIENAPYEEFRKQELKLVFKELQNDGLVSKDFDVDAFIKEESYSEYKCPRGIYSRSDKFKCFSGPLLKLLQDIVFKHPSFIKVVPVNQRPKYVKDMFYGKEGYIYSADFKAYESHFTKEMMEMIEFEAYDYLCSLNDEAMDIMAVFKRVVSGLNNIKFGDMTVTVPATRMSGEMNTSFGNGLVNMVIINYICEIMHGEDVVGVVEGDDSLFKTNALITAQNYNDCGFSVELEQFDNVNEASFCGLIFDDQDEVVIADGIKYILKTPWINRRWLNARLTTHYALYKSRALSLLWQFPGCPIIIPYATYLMRMTYPYKLTMSIAADFKWNRDLYELIVSAIDDFDAVMNKIPYKDITFNTRLLYERIYDLPIDLQIEIETYFDNKNDLSPFYHPIIEMYVTGDQRHFYENHILDLDIDLTSAKDMSLNWFGSSNEKTLLFDLLKQTKTSKNNLKLLNNFIQSN